MTQVKTLLPSLQVIVSKLHNRGLCLPASVLVLRNLSRYPKLDLRQKSTIGINEISFWNVLKIKILFQMWSIFIIVFNKTQFTIYQVCTSAVEEGVLVKLYLKAACFTYTQYTCLREVIMMYK